MLDDFNRDKFNDLFDDFLELEDQKKSIGAAQGAIKDEMCEILNESKSIVGKVITFLKKQRGDGEDEFDRINEIMMGLEK